MEGKSQRAGHGPNVPHRLRLLLESTQGPQIGLWGGSDGRIDNVHGKGIWGGWKTHGSPSQGRGLQAEPCNSERWPSEQTGALR